MLNAACLLEGARRAFCMSMHLEINNSSCSWGQEKGAKEQTLLQGEAPFEMCVRMGGKGEELRRGMAWHGSVRVQVVQRFSAG